MEKIPLTNLVSLEFLLFILAGGRLAEYCRYNYYYGDYHKYSQHADPHFGKVFYKIFRVERYCQSIEQRFKKHHEKVPPSTEKVQDYTAGDDRRDLTGNVYTDRMHKQKVLRIFLETHFVNYSARHREG